MQPVEGFARFGSFETWYRVLGELSTKRPPLVVVHGGPGLTHDYVEEFAELADGERAVVLYDQIGNGRSTHLPGKGREFWAVSRFADEIADLVRHLKIEHRHVVLGQSFGAAIAAEYACRKPSGLNALVLANGYASMPLFISGLLRLRRALPEDVQATLARHEQARTTANPEYQQALAVFFARHVCRLPPSPGLIRSLEALEREPTVFAAMYGPSLFMLEGTLKDWSVVDKLGEIRVPTLVYRGAFDESVAEAVAPFLERIPNVRGHVFPNSSHLPHAEERADCLNLVRDFLLNADPA